MLLLVVKFIYHLDYTIVILLKYLSGSPINVNICDFEICVYDLVEWTRLKEYNDVMFWIILTLTIKLYIQTICVHIPWSEKYRLPHPTLHSTDCGL